jgi:group I intron endonuclease
MPEPKLDTGVYGIRNKINLKIYIGSSAGPFKLRLGVHKSALRGGCHYNDHLQAAWNKYGETSFEFIIIERCIPQECVAKEQYWIDTYNSVNPEKGYNLSPTAGSTLGMKFSEEGKANCRERNRKRYSDPLYRKKHAAIVTKALVKTMATVDWKENLIKGVEKRNKDPDWRMKQARMLKLRAIEGGGYKTALQIKELKRRIARGKATKRN